ncbi:MAG: cytochrome c oxidase subunit II [Sphingobacteriales bacterium]|nr:cytochrome c oxidase subunit II [Sphingobacteriales bacterium]
MNIKKYLNLKSLLALLAVTVLTFQQGMAQAQDAVETVSKNDGLGKMVSYYLLLFLLACVFIGVIGKVLQVYELTRRFQGKSEGISWDKVNGFLFGFFLIVGLYGVYWSYTVQGNQILPDAASEHGVKIDNMFNITLIVTTIAFIATHILLFAFAYKYKRTKESKALYYPHNNTLEKYWTVIPAIVFTTLVVMGFFTWKGITNISPEQEKNALQIDVTAHQFAWEVRYSGKDNVSGKKNYKLIGSLGGLNNLGVDLSDKRNYDDLKVSEIVLPVNKSVRFTLTSIDVLHSFYMPHFRVQMNCVPGMSTYFQFTPTITTAEMQKKTGEADFKYELYCAKICGASHYNMKFPVRVVTQSEYDDWVKEQKPYITEQMKEKYQLAMKENITSDKNKIVSNN